MSGRRVNLRDEHRDGDHRYLDAWLDEGGNLHIDGQDLGPGTGPLGGDGEYEWFQVIPAASLPALRELLRIGPDVDLLDALEHSWSGSARSRALEERLRGSDIPIALDTWRS
jgi:hypothetical protein